MKAEFFGLLIVSTCIACAATVDIICGTNYLRQIRESDKSVCSGRD